MHSILYYDIDKELIKAATATRTKGGSGLSGLDADGWRRVIVSARFGTATLDLHKAIAELIKNLLSQIYQATITVFRKFSSMQVDTS